MKIYERLRDEYNFEGHIHGEKTIGQLLEEERSCFLPLQSERFEACRRKSTFVDSYSLVRINNVRYSVPVQWAYHPCVIKIFVDKIVVLCQGDIVAQHWRSYKDGQFVLDPVHYLRLLQRKPGSLDNARAFKGQPWGEDFDFMRRELEYRYKDDGTTRYIKILMLFTQYPQVQVKTAVSMCVKRRAFSEDAVLNILNNEPLGVRGKLDLSDKPELVNKGNGIRSAGIYDQIRQRQEVLI